MSIESAKAFIERMETDEEFSERVKSVADQDERSALVKTEGFDFSTEDIKAVKSGLSDEELDGISGGGQSHCNVSRHVRTFCMPPQHFE